MQVRFGPPAPVQPCPTTLPFEKERKCKPTRAIWPSPNPGDLGSKQADAIGPRFCLSRATAKKSDSDPKLLAVSVADASRGVLDLGIGD